jgi:deazaflavin-dependent oxidoreductase (nitroreductase family)
MGSPNQSGDQRLRCGFKWFNRFMVLLWRLGMGPTVNAWPAVGGRIMVISHTGRRSGRRRRTPVNYSVVDHEIYCTAGFGSDSDWYLNLRNDPEVEVWLPDGWWAGIAEEVTDARIRVPLLRQVLIASGFVAHLAGLDPHMMTNEELDSATRGYRLIRIHRTRACTGPGGPGDLAWLWQIATYLLLLALLLRPKRR